MLQVFFCGKDFEYIYESYFSVSTAIPQQNAICSASVLKTVRGDVFLMVKMQFL